MTIEEQYLAALDSQSPAERAERGMQALAWLRDFLARRIEAEAGPQDLRRLRIEVALRMYSADPVVRGLLEEELVRAPL